METEPTMSRELYSILNKFMNSNDILEDPNFDAIAYLNEKFPDFESLNSLPGFISDWEKEISQVDDNLDSLIAERARYSDEIKLHMNELNNDVSLIINLINDIKKSADINESTVKAICNDIKSLDNAKNNLTTTISSLTKLLMLINGIESLEKSVKSKNFKEAAYQIEACNDIFNFFIEYKNVTQINQLQVKKDNLCSSLNASILQEFKNHINQLPANEEILYNACLCANAIGDNSINALKTWFISYKLMAYDEIFDPNKETDRIELSETERRFEWIKRIFVEYNTRYSNVFLQSWGFKTSLCQEFCRQTKVHLNDQLSKGFDENTNKIKFDVDILVKVLNTTIHFENNMSLYLSNEYEKLIKILSNENDNGEFTSTSINESLSNLTEHSSIEDIKIKYEDKEIKQRKDPNKKPLYSLFRIKGIISECFEQYMISYVDIEQKKLIEIINNLKVNDKLEGKLWISSLHLFKNIQQAMNRCLSFNNGKIFYDLVNSFDQVFHHYANSLLLNKIKSYSAYLQSNISSLINTINQNQIQQGNQSSYRNLTEDDIKIICLVINTCDYCFNTITALSESIKSKLDEKYNDKIFFEASDDSMKEIRRQAFEILNNYIKIVCHDKMSIIYKQNNEIEEIEGLSTYVSQVKSAFSSIITTSNTILNEYFIVHIINMLPKILSESFLTSFYKIKKINEIGAQKLLMEVFELKSFIIETFKEVSKYNENDFNTICLNKLIKSEIELKIETRLKCISSITSEVGNAYKSFVGDKSKDDFEKLILMRGIKKQDIFDYENVFK